MKTTRSEALFARAVRRIPGGVNSPVRAFKSVGLSPRFIARARGSSVWDEDGNRYIDYIGSWGPMILGHSHPAIIAAVKKAAATGTSFGAATKLEVEMAELIARLMPSIEMVRMVTSGTEATMSAIRLARAYTGRSKIIKFDGCYHGHADAFLIKAGSGAMTFGVPDSPGIVPAVAGDTLIAQFNDIRSVERLVDEHPNQIAALIVEPVVGNMGCIPPRDGFLRKLRDVCSAKGIVYIMDEVMTGFRVASGGAQELFGVRPDLTTLGKIIGGGLPVGAYGGRKEIMKMVAPSGPVYQAGTLSGNPLAMAAGSTMLKLLQRRGKSVYRQLESTGAKIEKGFADITARYGLPLQVNRVGSMFTLFFTSTPVTDAESARRSDTKAFSRYFSALIESGVFIPPSQFEAAFISTAHTAKDIDATLHAAEDALKKTFGYDGQD